MENEVEETIGGIPLIDLYNCDLSFAYDVVKNNFGYLKKVSLENVKTIKFSYYKDIVILLKNGNVIVNGEEELYAIKDLIFLGGDDIFAVTKNLEVINAVTRKELFNFKYKFTKVYYDALKIVTLDDKGDIRVYGTLVNEYVDPFKLTEIKELGYACDDVVVEKNNKYYFLFKDGEVANDKVVVLGQENDYTIITK